MGKASRKLKEAVNEIYKEPKEDEEINSPTEDTKDSRTVENYVSHGLFPPK